MPVQSIIDERTFQAAAEQLALNEARSLRNTKVGYLLRGMLTCSMCGEAYYGFYRATTSGATTGAAVAVAMPT